MCDTILTFLAFPLWKVKRKMVYLPYFAQMTGFEQRAEKGGCDSAPKAPCCPIQPFLFHKIIATHNYIFLLIFLFPLQLHFQGTGGVQ